MPLTASVSGVQGSEMLVTVPSSCTAKKAARPDRALSNMYLIKCRLFQQAIQIQAALKASAAMQAFSTPYYHASSFSKFVNSACGQVTPFSFATRSRYRYWALRDLIS